jgi:hypothetical protein
MLARHVTAVDFDRFAAVATDVLGSPDPRFEMEADERWLAATKAVQPGYSELLRGGLGELEQLARGADALGQPEIAQKFREEIAKPKEISEQVLPEYLEAIQRRIRQPDEWEGGYPLPGFDQDDLF